MLEDPIHVVDMEVEHDDLGSLQEDKQQVRTIQWLVKPDFGVAALPQHNTPLECGWYYSIVRLFAQVQAALVPHAELEVELAQAQV